MSRLIPIAIVLVAVVLGVLPYAGASPRPDAVELRARTGSLGQLPRIVLDDGGAYVSAERLAAMLRGAWSA